MPEIDYYILKRSLTGWEDECGDTGIIRVYDGQCFLGLIDVLGHGKEAYDIAILSENYIAENHRCNLVDIMNGLHAHLKGTRGAVATLCRLNLANGELNCVGIGNISTRLFSTKSLHIIPRDGIIGYMITAPKQEQLKLYSGDILVLSSDGLRENFDCENYPNLLKGSAKKIATDFMDFLNKGNDDASCIVLRYGI
ncbi:MAG: SpoIIE family protein phosphatase [Desulfobacterales bacterium]|nr:SpoIIE family protein phosphatase [Desulfobacterales bacterium]MBF0398729.1 SpoIIE family protein phosphatase [Desulfobacterales bacterium]